MKKSFEEKLSRLEEIQEKLRVGNTPLADSLALFEEGVTLAKELETELAHAEQKVEILLAKGTSTEDSPGTIESFDLF